MQILSVPNSVATPFQSGSSTAVAPPASIFIGTGGYNCFNFYIFPASDFLTPSVLHPAGNVAEHLVAAGLARVVDWHAGMLASTGGMERLRAAEKTAKERRICLYAHLPATATVANGNGSGSANGSNKIFDATVIRVWSGDQLSVVEKESGKERRLQLSSTRGPKLGSNHLTSYLF